MRSTYSGNGALGVVALVLTLVIGGLWVGGPAPTRAGATVLENNGADGRNAWDNHETTLTPSVITSGSFGQIFATHLEGAIMGQPVVVNGMLVVGTEDDRIYGMNPATGAVVWSRIVGTPIQEARQQGCNDIPIAGITASPVVDPATGAVYFMAKSYTDSSSSQIAFQLHKIDPATGAEYQGFPSTLGGVADNDASVTFDGTNATQRTGLLLNQGVVYAGFASVCDIGNFRGWVIGVNGTTGAPTARFVTEVGDGSGAGVWQSGSGISSDGPGQLLLSTGNGSTPTVGTVGSSPPGALGQSIIRLSVQPDGTLKPVDFFTPIDGPALNVVDGDVGSGGPIVLPSSFQTPSVKEIVAAGGKGGYVYLMNGKNLGGMGTGPNGSDNNLETLGPLGAMYGDPVAWSGGGGYLYASSSLAGFDQGGAGPSLAVYKWGTTPSGAPSMTLVGSAREQPGFGTSSPVLSSNGTATSSGILWQTWQPIAGGNEELRAFNPIPVNGQLQELWSAPVGSLSKFLDPVIDQGHVYVGSGDGTLYGFGVAAPAPLAAISTAIAPTPAKTSRSSTVTLRATTAVTVTSEAVAPGSFSVKPITSPISLRPGATLSIPVVFAPSTNGSISTTLTIGLNGFGSLTFPLHSFGIFPGPHLTLSSKILVFGSGSLSGSPVTAAVSVQNVGSTAATLSGATSPSAPFSVTGTYAGTVLQPGASTVVSFAMSTASTGHFTSMASITTSTQAVSVSLVGDVGQPAIVTVSPAMINFGWVPVGQSAVRTLTLTNTGATPANWAASIPFLASTQDFYSIVGTKPPSLIPGRAVETVKLRYTPQRIESDPGEITVNVNDGFVPRVVWLSGSGIAPHHLVVNAESINVNPGSTIAWVPVDVSPVPQVQVPFTVATSDGSATASSGAYKAIPSQSFVMEPGFGRIYVPVAVNTAKGGGGSFTVRVTAATGATTGEAATVSFRPSASADVSYVTVDPAEFVTNQVEDQVVQVPVTVSPIMSAPVTCHVTTSDGTASAAIGDYVALTDATVQIPATGRGTIPIAVKASQGLFDERVLTVTLTGCSGDGSISIVRPTASVTLLGLNGQPSDYEIQVQKEVIDAPAIGQAATGTVIVRNVGGTALTLYQGAPIADARFALLTPLGSGVVIQPGGTLSLSFSYTPTSRAMARSNFTLTTSTDSGPFSLNLIGQTG